MHIYQLERNCHKPGEGGEYGTQHTNPYYEDPKRGQLVVCKSPNEGLPRRLFKKPEVYVGTITMIVRLSGSY